MKNKKEIIETYIRQVVREVLNEQYTQKDLKFIDGKCVIKNGKKIVAKIFYRPDFYAAHGIKSQHSYPYSLEINGGMRECSDIDEVLLYLNKYTQ